MNNINQTVVKVLALLLEVGARVELAVIHPDVGALLGKCQRLSV
jgi:hypothetical protein